MEIINGYKMYIGGAGSILTGIYNIINGDIETGIKFILAGITIIGAGHKMDKAG